MTRFRLREATPNDLDLTYEITREAMQVYVEQAWGAWVEDEQQEKHRTNFTPDTHRIVLAKGNQEVGLLAVEEEPEYLWLVKVYLRQRARGAGLGSALVCQVIREANERKKSVRLRVLRVNTRAKALYERLGFQVVGSEPDRLFMVRPLSAA